MTVIESQDVDYAVDWLNKHAVCLCYGGQHDKDCPLDVGLALLREARRFDAHEPPL